MSRLSTLISFVLFVTSVTASAADSSTTAVDFVRDVQPIFATNCYRCHGPDVQKASLRLDVREIALKGGDDGVVIVPGHADQSLLFRLVAGRVPHKRMPAKGELLTPQQVQTLGAWIDQGATWPASASVVLTDKMDHWAFKPLTDPAPPPVSDAVWARTAIDRYILAKLEAKGLHPAPPADPRTLLRRVYFDVIGLPPTPEETAAFLADRSPDAYEKVVERLLASPRYGERWARHWMDTVHFAETHGNDEDRERPNAWPYRDYLIASFNSDKPFARFIEEQLAGDALYPDDPQATVALGFIAAGPWDESSQMGILDESIDKKIAQYLDRDDMVQTTLCTFDSVTVGCARCHNHKFDPISQADYYGLQAVFAGVDRAERPYDPDPALFASRHALLAQKRGLETGHYIANASPFDSKVQAVAEQWASGLASQGSHWTVLDPQTFTSAHGATLTKMPDGSILSGGTRPEIDTYTITATTPLADITQVRLELLTDPSLPHNGPGRQDNGNLHLNEFTVAASTAATPSSVQPVEIASAKADFDQDNWTIAMSIDHNAQTAWGIYPQISKPHTGVYVLKQPAGFEGGTRLTFTLEQSHGGGHLIGRVRISVTNAPGGGPMLDDRPLPAAVTKILAIPRPQRSEADQIELARAYLRTQIDGKIAALPPAKRVYAATGDFKADGNFKPPHGPRAVFVLRRGDINMPGDTATVGALRCVPGMSGTIDLPKEADESQRRAALARWISDPRNCLTWRSIANRVWQYHFGRGIVSTADDFGHMGATPSHPQLLDALASELLRHGGSLKHLHRLILTSNTYRQSSQLDPAAVRVDADDLLLWRMNRTRLDAESLHDAILKMSGRLDTTMGGPSARQFTQKPGVHATPVLDYNAFDLESRDARRLSVYRFLWRTMPDPFMDAMDCPDASQLAPTRSISVTALQALAMFNDRFVIRYGQHLAERVTRERKTPAEQVTRLFELCLNRQPTESEKNGVVEYVAQHGMANACRVLLNSNEFVFVN